MKKNNNQLINDDIDLDSSTWKTFYKLWPYIAKH